jgi:hypothetical protein
MGWGDRFVGEMGWGDRFVGEMGRGDRFGGEIGTGDRFEGKDSPRGPWVVVFSVSWRACDCKVFVVEQARWSGLRELIYNVRAWLKSRSTRTLCRLSEKKKALQVSVHLAFRLAF